MSEIVKKAQHCQGYSEAFTIFHRAEGNYLLIVNSKAHSLYVYVRQIY